MRETTLSEWKIIRQEADKPWLTHCIYENDNSHYAFYFSQIEEWSLMKYCTKLEIFEDKSNPKKIYDSGSIWYMFNPFNVTDFVFDWTKDDLVCFRRLINEGQNKYSYPFVVMNLASRQYTTINDKLIANAQDVMERLMKGNIQWFSLSRL